MYTEVAQQPQKTEIWHNRLQQAGSLYTAGFVVKQEMMCGKGSDWQSTAGSPAPGHMNKSLV